MDDNNEPIDFDESTLTITNKKWELKAKPSKELIQEILTIFSMPTLPSSPITTIDQILTRSILSNKLDDDALMVAAILLNFQTCIKIPIDEKTQLGEVLRKMIGFGFFSSQLYESPDFSNELHSLILFVSNHLKKSNLNIPQCSMATAFLLSCISPHVSKISLFNNLNGLQDILDIYLTKKVINDHIIPFFFDFFLSVFLSLTLDKELEPNEFQLFSTLTKILASTIMTGISFNFDYISLTKKILEYLSNHYLKITTRDELFNLIISLSSKYEESYAIIVEPSNSSKISTFISDYLKLIDFGYDLKKGSNPINLDTKATNWFISSSQTEFFPPFKIKNENSGYETIDFFEYNERNEVININAIPEPGELEPIKKVEKISMMLQGLIQRISNLCRSFSIQKNQVNHIQFLSSFLRSEGARIPIGAFFIDLWAKNISFIQPNTVAESFHNVKFYQTSLELAFFDYDDIHMKTFISSFILFIASFSSNVFSYIVDLINVFQNAIISVKLCPEICDLIVKCSVINPKSFVTAMKCSNFDILMADDLYFYLNNCNNIEATERSRDDSLRLLENYKLLLRFLIDLCHEPSVLKHLFSKNEFLLSILAQFFCPSTAEFSYLIISSFLKSDQLMNELRNQEVASPILRTIFKFFATKLFKTQGMPACVLNFVIQFCSLGFEKIEGQFGLIFEESHFFDIVVNLAIEQNLPNSIEGILNLFVQVTTSKKCSITPNIELFLKLGPMIRSRDDISVVDFLLKIIFNDDLKMTKSRKIVNPGPLSLLFQLFRDDKEKFKNYLKFVRECFEISKNETVQTDFTSQLIRYLHEYRDKTEKDEEFELVLDFLKDIMSISITQKDLLSFFQLFTSTKDNIRPFFTGDLIKALTSSIHNYQVTSRSFFSLDSKGQIILPPIPPEVLNSDFSIIMKIELHDRTGSIFKFRNPATKDEIELSFTEDKFLSLNNVQKETTLITGKLIRLTFSSIKNEYFLYVNYQNEPLIRIDMKPEERKKGSYKTGFNENIVGQELDANIEFIRIVYTNKNIKNDILYEFKAASFYKNLAIYRDEVARFECPIIHLPPSLLEVLVSIGGVQVILPIFNQIEQPTNATKPDPNENLLVLALNLLSTIFSKSRQLQVDFYSIDGFKLVSELLTMISINKFTKPVFDEIFHLFSIIVEPELQNQMIESIFFDLGTWVYIPDILPLFFDYCFRLLITCSKKNRTFVNYSSLNIKNLLFLIRCHLFASTNTNDSICLSSTEKKTFTGDTFAERQTVKKLRDNFMIFISELCSIACNSEDIHTILFFCLDDQDEIFQRSSFTLLRTIMLKKNHKLNNFIISKIPYKMLIELLRNKENRKTSSQLLLFLSEAVSSKYIQNNYKKLIIAKTLVELNLFPIAILYLKQIFQKTAGDFHIILTLNLLSLLLESNQKAPVINAKYPKNQTTTTNATENQTENPTENPETSENTNSNDAPIMMSDEDVMKQIVLIYKELTSSISVEEFIENEIFFIIFLLHAFLDKKKYETIFEDLLNLTMNLWVKKLNDPFGFLHKLIETIEWRSKNDYSDFLRHIYMSSINHDFQKSSIESITNVVHRFLFEIPSFDSYSSLFRFPQPTKPLTFQEIFLLANNDSIPFTATYHYSLRVNDNCKWLDFELANLIFEKYLNNNSNTCKTIVLEQLAYIIGNGINNKKFFDNVGKFIEMIKIVKNPKSDTESSLSKSRRNAIIILFGSISREILHGNFNEKNDEVTIDQLTEVFKTSLESLHNEASIILKEKNELSNDLNVYLSSFATLITKVESDYENRLSSTNNNNIDLPSANSSNISLDQDNVDCLLGTYTTANDPNYVYADLSILEANKKMNINIEQYRASLSNYATARRKQKLQSLKRYKQLYSQLNSENGPWMSPENPPELHYKLFNTLTRSLLVPNLKYNDHKEASLARDLGSYENAQAIVKEQIAKMKMQTFSTDFSLVDFKDEDEGQEKNEDDSANSRKQQSNSNNEKDLMICQSQIVTPRKLHSGDLNLTIRSIIFNSKNKYVRIRLNKIKKIMLRRYLMVDTAIEIFTTYSKVYFINFINAQERLKFLNKVSSLKVPNIKFIQKKWDDTKALLKKLIKKWQDGLISNFDYLMKINILAGRSFNDLSQYPVFPWVIKDYTSDELDLSNHEIYRCFSKPIGAIGQQRLALMREKMELGVGEETKYLYGALYSSPAVVIGYLIRMEPFTSLHVQLQSNRFDVADRLFISIPGAYESVTTSQMDFRELIPEFFILPDFLRNDNKFDLGISIASGNRVDDVILPPWCSSPREFIEINRRALESNFVTMNIHQWIDLIFGPHSRAPLSFEVDNVFSPAFYETALEGADERQVTYLKECAACFGCACLQIFDDYPEGLAVSINRKSFIGVPKSHSKIGEFVGKPIVALNSDKSDTVAVTNDLHFLLNENKGRLSCAIPPSIADRASPFISINGKRNVAVALKWSNAVNVYHLRSNNNVVCEPSPFDSLPMSFTSSNNVVTAISISNNFLAVAFSDFTLRVFKITNKPPNSIPLTGLSSLSSSGNFSQISLSSTTGPSAALPTTSSSSIQTNHSNPQSAILPPQISQGLSGTPNSIPALNQSQNPSNMIQADVDTSVGVAVAVGSAAAVDSTEMNINSLAMKRQVCFLTKHTHSILFTTVSEKVGAVYSISSDGFLSSMSLNQGGRYLRGVETGFYEPTNFIISRLGFIVVAFNGPDSANIVVYDQNLEKIVSTFHEAAVETWTVADRGGEEMLLVVNKGTGNNEIEFMRLPFLEKQKKSFATQGHVTAISFVKKPTPKIALGYASGVIEYANLE